MSEMLKNYIKERVKENSLIADVCKEMLSENYDWSLPDTKIFTLVADELCAASERTSDMGKAFDTLKKEYKVYLIDLKN